MCTDVYEMCTDVYRCVQNVQMCTTYVQDVYKLVYNIVYKMYTCTHRGDVYNMCTSCTQPGAACIAQLVRALGS